LALAKLSLALAGAVSGHGAPQLRGERTKLANKISTLGEFYDFKKQPFPLLINRPRITWNKKTPHMFVKRHGPKE